MPLNRCHSHHHPSTHASDICPPGSKGEAQSAKRMADGELQGKSGENLGGTRGSGNRGESHLASS